MYLKFLHLAFFSFICQVIKSDDSALNDEISNTVKKILQEYNIEDNPSEYANSTISLLNSSQELFLKHKMLSLKHKKLELVTQLLQQLVEIIKHRTNITRHTTKMLGYIEELQYSLVKSIKKENLADIDDLLNFEVNEQITNECIKTINKLKRLKFQIHAWNQNFGKFEDMSSLVEKFADDEDIPEMVWNEIDEESFSKIGQNDDEGDSKIEKLQRMSLLIEDRINETPKDELVQEDDFYTSELPEGEEVPRWLLTEKDIEEIRSKYLRWMSLFENSDSPVIKEMKEAIVNSGQSLKMFCKTLAEYFNLTTKLLECATKDDSECEDMLMQIFDQPHIKQFIQLFHQLTKDNKDVFPL